MSIWDILAARGAINAPPVPGQTPPIVAPPIPQPAPKPSGGVFGKIGQILKGISEGGPLPPGVDEGSPEAAAYKQQARMALASALLQGTKGRGTLGNIGAALGSQQQSSGGYLQQLLARKNEEAKAQQQQVANKIAQQNADANTTNANKQPGPADEIAKLNADFTAGRISSADYEKRKAQLLAPRAEPNARTQLIQSMGPDPNDPTKTVAVYKLVDTNTGATINPNVAGIKATPGAAGARAQSQFDRIHTSASLATKALENLSKLPISTNRGFLGSSEAGSTLTGSTLSALGNIVTTQDSQRYKVLTNGLRRNLATIEAAGSAQGLAGLTKMIDQAESIPGDDYITQISRLAETRQIITEGLNAYRTHPTISDEQKKAVDALITRTEKAIPYTQDDITELQYSNDPNLTIDAIIKKRQAAESGQFKDPDKEKRYQEWKAAHPDG